MNNVIAFCKVGLLSLFALAVVLIPVAGELHGATNIGGQNSPERQVTLAAEYSGIVIGQDKDISLDLILKNKGRRDENLRLRMIEVPENWDAAIKTYDFGVTGVFIPADEEKRLPLKIDPGAGVQPGEYYVVVGAKTDDGVFDLQQPIFIDIRKKDIVVKEKGFTLTTSYPQIKGPSDGTFEFSIDVKSDLDEEAVVNLYAKGPDGWDVNIKPAYESKYISSIRLKANQSQTIAVEVDPSYSATAGEYPVMVRVSSGDVSAEAELSVVLTGTYELEVGTATGLLSLDARQGKTATVSFYIRNTGSAVNNSIELMSFKPENWTVEFSPEKISAIEPGEMAQVEMTITPNEEALVGDYSVDVKIQGEKASPSLKFRVSVKASAVWGGIGIVIIIIVIIGLFVIFKVFGRR